MKKKAKTKAKRAVGRRVTRKEASVMAALTDIVEQLAGIRREVADHNDRQRRIDADLREIIDTSKPALMKILSAAAGPQDGESSSPLAEVILMRPPAEESSDPQ